MYEPVGGLESPRYSGPRTFARLPALAVTEGVDVAIFGMPWDSGTSFRPGARFGPEGVRSASALLRPYNPAQDVLVFGGCSCVDYGDAPTVPGYIEDTLERIAGYVTTIHRGGAIPLGIGGDHSVTLAELRAAAAVHGPLGLVHLDSHHDVWDSLLRAPAKPRDGVPPRAARRAARPVPVPAGGHARRAVLGADDYAASTELGMEIVPWSTLRTLSAGRVRRAGARTARRRPGVLHVRRRLRRPGVLPGNRYARGRGPTSAHALDLVRALRGIDFRAFDVVEVAPAYDGPGQVTALLAANVMFEFLSLVALAR